MALPKKPEKRESYNPLLKSYPDSEKINGVSEGAEVLYVRLIAQSDDKGRYWADPMMVLAKLFTHRMASGQLTVADVQTRLQELERIGLIEIYEVDGKKYLTMVGVVKRLRKDVTPHIFCPEPLTSVVTTLSRTRATNRTQPNPTQPLTPDRNGSYQNGREPASSAPPPGAQSDPSPVSGSYEEVTAEMLRSAAGTDAWFQAGKRFGKLTSDFHRLRVHAMAVHALRIGKSPARLFVKNIKAGDWKVLTDADVDDASRRLRSLASPAGHQTELDTSNMLRRAE